MSTVSIFKDETKKALALMNRFIVFFNYNGSVCYKWINGTPLLPEEENETALLIKDAMRIYLESGEVLPSDSVIASYVNDLLSIDLT